MRPMCNSKGLIAIIVVVFLMSTASFAQTSIIIDGKTVNVTDVLKQKQGIWYYFFDSLHTQVSCKGMYVDNNREGVWTEYYRNGKVKSEITYQNNKKFGYMKSFYENGNIAEEGSWDGAHWIGVYKYYYTTGKIAYEWYYGQGGNREGMQNYYYENGTVMRSGNWVNGCADGIVAEYYDSGHLRSESQWKMGRVDGIMKEYYDSGNLKAKRVYSDGVYDVAASKIYRDKPKEENIVIPSIGDTLHHQEEVIVSKDEEGPMLFTGSGYHKIVNKDKRVDREGEFENGKLINGRRYYYNSTGKLLRIAVYERGRVVQIIE